MGMSELNSELERIHLEIARLLGLPRENLVFEYMKEGDDKTILRLITVNPRHKQSFLFHQETGFGEMDVLHKMLDYVKTHKHSKDSYTIQWSLKDGKELHTSYFRGKNIYEVLDKFYYGKDITSTIIFSISLNPIS
jgi:hypothetical protein